MATSVISSHARQIHGSSGIKYKSASVEKSPENSGNVLDDAFTGLELLSRLPPPLSPTLPPSIPPLPSSTSSNSSGLKRTRGKDEEGNERELEKSNKTRILEVQSNNGGGASEGEERTATKHKGLTIKRSASSLRNTTASSSATTSTISSPNPPKQAETGQEAPTASNANATGRTAPAPQKAHNSAASAPDSVSRNGGGGPGFGTTSGDEVHVGPEWNEERFRHLSVAYRERGRTLKHSGDRRMRDPLGPSCADRSLAEQTDAVFLYCYSFYCDDRVAKSFQRTNWKTIFGLLEFVKKKAMDSKYDALVGVCLMLEGAIVNSLATHGSRQSHLDANRYLTSLKLPSRPTDGQTTSPPRQLVGTVTAAGVAVGPESGPSPLSLTTGSPNGPNDTHTPRSTTSTTGTGGGGGGAGTGPGGIELHSAQQSSSTNHPQQSHPPIPQPQDLVLALDRYNSELRRSHQIWSSGLQILSPSFMCKSLSSLYTRLKENELRYTNAIEVVPTPVEGAWKFSWPLEIGGNMNHLVCFARCLLQEWCLERGVEYRCAVVLED